MTCTAIWAVLVCVGQDIGMCQHVKNDLLPPTSDILPTPSHIEACKLWFSYAVYLDQADGLSAWLVEPSPRSCPGSNACGAKNRGQ